MDGRARLRLLSNRELSKALGRVLHRPTILPAPGFALRIILGEVAGLLFEGQHVTPVRALEEGFSFRFPEIESAFHDLLSLLRQLVLLASP